MINKGCLIKDTDMYIVYIYDTYFIHANLSELHRLINSYEEEFRANKPNQSYKVRCFYKGDF